MKTVSIAGRVGKDAELRHTQNGDAVASFSVAVDDGWGERKTTIWFSCSVWGKRAEKAAELIRKGTAIALNGDLGMNEYNGKTSPTVRVNDFTLQGGKPSDRAHPDGFKTEQSGYSSGPANLDDSIPFAPEWR